MLKINTDSAKKTSNQKIERYEYKDSLYIDVGQPMLNGRIDTINSPGLNSPGLNSPGFNAHNDSLLLTQGPSNNSTMSRFAGGQLQPKKETSILKRAGNSLLKTALVNTAERNCTTCEDESPKKAMRQDSGLNGKNTEFENILDKSPVVKEPSNEKLPVEKKPSDEKTPSKLNSPGKRYLFIDSKGTGNSPGYGSPILTVSNSQNMASPGKSPNYVSLGKSPNYTSPTHSTHSYNSPITTSPGNNSPSSSKKIAKILEENKSPC